PELGAKPRASQPCDLDRPVGLSPLQPAELEQPRRQRGSHSAGDVPAPLAPVETRADESSALPCELAEVDPERRESSGRRPAETVSPSVRNEDAIALECRGQLDAETAG